MKRIKGKKEQLGTELIIKNMKAVRVNLTHMVRRASQGIFQVVRATRNPKAVNQNLIHTENRVMGRVPMPTRVAMENLMVTKKDHTEATEDMARVLLNTLCIIKTNWV